MKTEEKDDVAAAALYLDLIKRRFVSSFRTFDEWAAAWIANDNLQVAEGLLHCVFSLPDRLDARPVRLLMSIINITVEGEKFPRWLREKALAVLVDHFLKEDDVYPGAPFGWGLIRKDPKILIDVMTLLCDLDRGLRLPDSRLKIVKWFLACCYGALRALDQSALRKMLEGNRSLLFMTLLRYDMDNTISSAFDQDTSDAKRWFKDIGQDIEALDAIACQHGKSIDGALLYSASDGRYRDSRKAAFLCIILTRVYLVRQAAFSAPQ